MSIKKNVIYSGILTTSLYVFQFITYPYVARVLGVTNIGICNFVQSIVQYFVLFAALGTMSLGVREIAKCNGDKEKRDRVFSAITVLNVLVTSFVLVCYIGATLLVPQLQPYRQLLYIGALQLVSSVFTVEWLFRGLENFKFITLRNLAIRILYVLGVFVFVRTRDDYNIYFVLTVGLYFSNALVNLCYSRHFVHFRWLQVRRCVKEYLKPMSLLGIQNILLTMYTSFNVVYLGFVAGDTQVGYYTTATKIQNIILALFSAFTLVMMPRISALVAKKEYGQVKQLINLSLSVLYAFAIPVIIIVVVLSPDIIQLIAGSEYGVSINLLRIAIPLILVIGLEQVLITQLLIPIGNDKDSFNSYLAGAIVGILLNVALVPMFESLGSVIVWAASEITVMAVAFYYVKRQFDFADNIFCLLFRYLLAFAPLAVATYILRLYPFAVVAVTIFYCHVCLYSVVRNTIYINSVNNIIYNFLCKRK